MTVGFASFEASGTEAGVTQFATVYSSALGRRGDVSALSTVTRGPVHVVVLLHGVYGSHWVWDRRGGAGATVLRFARDFDAPVLAVMPSDGLWGIGSGYTGRGSEHSDAWILDEIPALVERWYPELDCATWSIAGLSMGGYGALRLAASRPSQYAAVSAMSPLVSLGDIRRFTDLPQHDEAPGSEALVASLSSAGAALPPLRVSCGTDDALLPAVLSMCAQLREAGVAHDLSTPTGGHDWNFWASVLERDLPFLTGRRDGAGA